MPRSLYQLLHLPRHHGSGFAGIFVIERQQNASDFVELGAGFIGLIRFLRVAEEVVQRLLHFADGGARFGNDLFQAALVVETCVERFHPFGGWLHLFAALHGFQALRKQGNAFVKLLAVGRGVFCRCFQKEDGGCHFHGNVGVGRLPRLSNVRRDALQHTRERRGGRPQGVQALQQNIGLAAQCLHFVFVACANVRPQIFEGANGFAQALALCRIHGAVQQLLVAANCYVI